VFTHQVYRRIFYGTIAISIILGVGWMRSRPPEVQFEKHLIDTGASETSAFADINRDGRLDIVSSEYWYEAPAWKPHKFREILFQSNYIDNFSDLPLDVNGDGWIDIVSCSWFGREFTWWENPGGGSSMWTKHVIDSGSPIESAMLADIDNDGKAQEVLPMFGSRDQPLAWYELKNHEFVKHIVSSKSYLFGLGAGDLNGDGRNDILTAEGWFEAPADPRSGEWKWHPDWTFTKDLADMYAFDVNGDGRNDVIASYAHDYGIFWIEQRGDGKWITHVIDDSWSQAHDPVLADINGDGRPELVVGKRYMAHNGHDPGEREPLGLYWYEFTPKGEWTRHILDYGTRAGGGMQIALADFDGDGDLDLAAGGKSGLFLFENLTKMPGPARRGRVRRH
jgi:hypothetical protein